MATVYIGSARIDERGKASGGQAGDQTGKEVSTQNWYLHSKGWVVLRPKDGAKAKKIAEAMQAACDNANIGYDQYNNQSLWNLVKDKGYDPAKADKPCEKTVAMAAPATPHPSVRMQNKSSTMFSMVEKSRNQNGVLLSPNARMMLDNKL